MKKYIIALVALGCAASVLAQGTVTFNNRISGTLVNKVYSPEVGDPYTAKFGNTATDTPVGAATTYTGSPLIGNAWTAQLWAASGAGAAEGSLLAGTPTTTFRTGTAAGQVAQALVAFANVAKDAPAATVQVRVFPSTYANWANAEAAWLADNASTVWIGKSQLFTVNAIGGDFNSPPNLLNMTSFSLVAHTPVPEPSTIALLGLGALGMMIFRRK